MAFDAHKNLAIATVATPPSPAPSGATLTVGAGEGARFPAPPFNATVWPADQPPTPINAELVRVTAITGDTFTLTRAQEGTTARTVVAGDLLAATITAKTITDLESGTNFPLIATETVAASGDISANTVLVFTNPGLNNAVIKRATADGADTLRLFVCGGGEASPDRGSYFWLAGNEGPDAGALSLVAGNMPGSGIQFFTGNLALRGKMHPSGGFSWGGVPDPGAGNIGAVAFTTGSDARLKDDRGPRITPDVLRRTVVHDFTWKADGTPGRGVFAQEAAAVAPFAVTVGTDDIDDDGRLLRPWGVDYAKYVPDLIVGWQYLEAEVTRLRAQNAALDARLAALEAAAAKG